ncbi:MAG: hypothetical protein RMM58_08200 [Chloroflexota bacterium]|nr:hypothetical protein [Dehalococcoidia bacterium]MDW8253844.1 hypothetical protein [Chloroflexota bacterium]
MSARARLREAVRRHRDPRRQKWSECGRRRWLLPLLLFLGVTGVFWAILPHRIDALRPLATPLPAPTGDEPYYLEMALSLLRYGSLELTRARSIDRLYSEFYPEPLLGHEANSPRGHVSKHYPGLSVLIAPFYLVGDALGRGAYGAGRFAVALALGVVGGLVAMNIFLVARETGGGTWWSAAVALLLAFSSPLLSYSFLIFPELPAALLTVYAFRRARLPNGSARTLLTGAALGLLPWLHPRFIVLALALAAWFVIGRRRTAREVALLLAPAAVSAAGIVLYHLWAFGSPLPNSGDHAGFGGPQHLLIGAAGLLLDQQWGLLIYAPIYLLVAAGLPALVVHRRRDALGLLIVTLPYFLLIAAYLQWWGEWGPPARYLTAVVPLAALPLAAARPACWWQWGIAALLALPSLTIGVLFVLWPETMYNHPTGHGHLWLRLADSGLPNLVPFLPSFVAPGADGALLMALWIVFAGLAAALLTLSGPGAQAR